jgi:glycerophosphoryl diester phosphodiesterase
MRWTPVVLLAALPLMAATPKRSRFDLQGHRGARGLAPENTLAAFARALSLGVTTLELDLGVTADGVVVVTHDPELNPDLTRDAQGRWLERPGPPIVRLTYDALRAYDVGRVRPDTPYAARYPDQVAADGQRIPRLADVFALVTRSGNSAVRFNVETKSDPRKVAPTLAPEPFAEAVIRVIRQHEMQSRATIQSFDWRTLRHARRVAPEIGLVCLTVQRPGDDNVEAGRSGAPATLGGLDVDDFGGSVPRLVKAAGCAVWSPNALDLEPALVSEAHALGLSVIPWTLNDPKQMETFIGYGVDGIITDRPDRLRERLVARGLPVPAATPVVP